MFTLNTLPKTTTRPKKRVARGYGSGKGGHTAGRGTKGQKSRGKVRPLFEGTKANKDFYRKVPMLRGKGKLKSTTKNPVIIKLSALSVFRTGQIVDAKALIKKELISEKNFKKFGVKILFDQKIDKTLDLQVPASKNVLKAVAAKKTSKTTKTNSTSKKDKADKKE